MKTYFAIIAFIGVFAFLVLFIADRERKAGVERLSDFKFGPHSALEPYFPEHTQPRLRPPNVAAQKFSSLVRGVGKENF